MNEGKTQLAASIALRRSDLNGSLIEHNRLASKHVGSRRVQFRILLQCLAVGIKQIGCPGMAVGRNHQLVAGIPTIMHGCHLR